ncbi:MAG TPA: hypothetical protein VK369_13120 [Segetibacter sp.]|nr:hypothetical protein [Segetibacter sp.]
MFIRSLFLFTFIAVVSFSSCQKNKVGSNTPNNSTTDFNVTVTTFAGDASERGTKDDADPLKARFSSPKKLIWDDRNKSLYIADGAGASGLRKIDANGSVSTPVPYVGTSNEIYDVCLVPDEAGAVYFATTLGQLQKVADGGVPEILIDWRRQDGTRKEGNEVGSLDVAAISGPYGLAASPDGNIYFSNSWYKTIHKVDVNAVGDEVTEFAGTPTTGVSAPAFPFADGQGNDAAFGDISDMTVDGNGMVYVADGDYCTVRKITPSGMVSSFLTPSPNTYTYYTDKDGSISDARAGEVNHVSANGDGSLIFFATPGALRVIRPDKDVTTLTRFKDGINGITATADGKTVYVTSGYAVYKVSL